VRRSVGGIGRTVDECSARRDVGGRGTDVLNGLVELRVVGLFRVNANFVVHQCPNLESGLGGFRRINVKGFVDD